MFICLPICPSSLCLVYGNISILFVPIFASIVFSLLVDFFSFTSICFKPLNCKCPSHRKRQD